MYKLIQGANMIIRLSDNAFIPFDDANFDFKIYKEWLAQGNTPEDADEIEPVVQDK